VDLQPHRRARGRRQPVDGVVQWRTGRTWFGLVLRFATGARHQLEEPVDAHRRPLLGPGDYRRNGRSHSDE
jgi:hypothetical protein